MTGPEEPKSRAPQGSGYKEQTRLTLERLSRAGSEGTTPDDVGIDATLLERLVNRRLADRLPPLARGASYRYRTNENGATLLKPLE